MTNFDVANHDHNGNYALRSEPLELKHLLLTCRSLVLPSSLTPTQNIKNSELPSFGMKSLPSMR